MRRTVRAGQGRCGGRTVRGKGSVLPQSRIELAELSCAEDGGGGVRVQGKRRGGNTQGNELGAASHQEGADGAVVCGGW